IILDNPTIEMIAQMVGPLDGIVGYSFWSRFKTIIDYAAGTITFEPTQYKPEDVFGSVMRRIFFGQGDRRVYAPPALWGMAVEQRNGEPGVRVSKVYASSPAESAGLKAGDHIQTLDDRWTDSIAELYKAAEGVPASESVTLTGIRGAEK